MGRLFNSAAHDSIKTSGNTTGTNVTVAGWFYEASRVSTGGSNPAAAHVLWSANDGSGGYYHEVASDNGVLYLVIGATWISSALTLPLATFSHVAFTVAGCPGPYNLYLNAGAPKTGTFGGQVWIRNLPVLIGAWSGTVIPDAPAAGWFDGKMADFAVWNIALTANEITALANGARPSAIRPGNLLTYLPLDGLQSPEPDLSGNATNGALTGTAFASGPPVTMFTPRWPRNYDPVAVTTIPLSQTHFRFRTDTGAVDATPTWGDAEDAA